MLQSCWEVADVSSVEFSSAVIVGEFSIGMMQEYRPTFVDLRGAYSIIEAQRLSTKHTEDMAEHSRAVVEALERHIVNITCDDPGLELTSLLILPMLQERIESAAREAAEEKAAQAQRDLGIIDVRILTSCWRRRPNIAFKYSPCT